MNQQKRHQKVKYRLLLSSGKIESDKNTDLCVLSHLLESYTPLPSSLPWSVIPLQAVQHVHLRLRFFHNKMRSQNKISLEFPRTPCSRALGFGIEWDTFYEKSSRDWQRKKIYCFQTVTSKKEWKPASLITARPRDLYTAKQPRREIFQDNHLDVGNLSQLWAPSFSPDFLIFLLQEAKMLNNVYVFMNITETFLGLSFEKEV